MCSNQLTHKMNATVPQKVYVYSTKCKCINISWKNTPINPAGMKEVQLVSYSINFLQQPEWKK